MLFPAIAELHRQMFKNFKPLLVVVSVVSAISVAGVNRMRRPRIVLDWVSPSSMFVQAYVDGEQVAAAYGPPVTLVCPVGDHSVRLESAGYQSLEFPRQELVGFARRRMNCDWKPTQQRRLERQADDLLRRAKARQVMPKPMDDDIRTRVLKVANRSGSLIDGSRLWPAFDEIIRLCPTATSFSSEMEKSSAPLLWKFGDARLRHVGTIRELLFTSDGAKLISCGDDGRIAVFDARNGERLEAWDAHTSGVSALARDANDRRLFSGDYQGNVRFWDMETGETSVATKLGALIECIDVHPAGTQFVIGCRNGKLAVYGDDAKLQDEVRLPAAVSALCYSPEGNWIAVACQDGTGGVFASDSLEQKFELTCPKTPRHIYFSPKSDRLTVNGGGESIVWNVTNGQQVNAFRNSPGIIGIARDGSWVADRRKNGRGFRLRLRDRAEEFLLEVGANQPTTVAKHEDRIAVGMLGGSISIYSRKSGEMIASPLSSSDNWRKIALDQTGERLAACTASGRIEVIHVPERTSEFSIPGSGEQIEEIFLSTVDVDRNQSHGRRCF